MMRSTVLLWFVAAAAAPLAHDEPALPAPSAINEVESSGEQGPGVEYTVDPQPLGEPASSDQSKHAGHQDSNVGEHSNHANQVAQNQNHNQNDYQNGHENDQNENQHDNKIPHGAGHSEPSSPEMSDMPPSPASMEHHHGRPILQNPHLEPQQRKYWEQYNTTTFFTAESGSKFNLWTHAVLSIVAFALLSPLTLIMSNDKNAQWLYVPLQTAQTAVGCLSILFLWFYAPTAPALYTHNAYAPFSIAMFVLICAHWLFMIVRAISTYMAQGDMAGGRYEFAGPASGVNEMEDEENAASYALDDLDDENHESGSSTECGSDTDQSSFEGHHSAPPMPKPELQRTPQMSSMVRKLAQNKLFSKLNRGIGGIASVMFNTMNIPMFFVGWGYLLTGLATAFVMGKGHYVFALLAHFIKGFVFVVLGFVELSRFFGAGSSRGWAWNELFTSASPRLRSRSWLSKLRFWPENASIEFWQCFLIFFYGSTNVFLEHLGNTDGVWSHKDLQHASIAFMFFGGGLCGMILESRTVKRSLASAFGNSPRDRLGGEVRHGWSMNPMPAFIIFWTGALMSHHEQETELSTAIHIQWGYLFSLAALVRLVTLGLLFTKPRVHSHSEAAQPQKPFTEVITAFCLVCGGMIFMSSNRESVEGMIYRGIDQMFTLNVSVGVTVILMAYFTGCLAVKGWASSRY